MTTKNHLIILLIVLLFETAVQNAEAELAVAVCAFTAAYILFKARYNHLTYGSIAVGVFMGFMTWIVCLSLPSTYGLPLSSALWVFSWTYLICRTICYFIQSDRDAERTKVQSKQPGLAS